MPISELLPVDFSSQQFANNHAAGLLSAAPQDDNRFADYIASIMNSEVTSSQYAHEPSTDQESAAAESVSPVLQPNERVAVGATADSAADASVSQESAAQSANTADQDARSAELPNDSSERQQTPDTVSKHSGNDTRKTKSAVDDRVHPDNSAEAERLDRLSVFATGDLATTKNKVTTQDVSGQERGTVGIKDSRPELRVAHDQTAKHQILDLRSSPARSGLVSKASPNLLVHQAAARGVQGKSQAVTAGGNRSSADRLAPGTRASKGRKTRLAANRSVQNRAAQPVQELQQQTQTSVEALRGPGTAPSGFESMNEAGGSLGQAGRASNIQVLTARANAQSPGGIGQALSQNLQESVNDQIVRSSRMLVRDNARGEIRLHLKPEHLGDVRFFMELHEGRIAGRIIVENSTIREVFEDNIPDLVKAFTDGGFESAMLDVTVSDSGQKREEGVAVAPHKVKELERAVPEIQMFEDDHVLVDMVV